MKNIKKSEKASIIFMQLVYQFVLKTVYEIILIPVVAPAIRKLKELEGDIVRE